MNPTYLLWGMLLVIMTAVICHAEESVMEKRALDDDDSLASDEAAESAAKRIFRYGRAPVFRYGKRAPVFRYGKRDDADYDGDSLGKRVFRWGKRDDDDDLTMNDLLQAEQMKRAHVFRYGKRNGAYDVDAEKRRIFNFGKRADGPLPQGTYRFGDE